MATLYHQQAIHTQQARPPTRRQPLGPGDARANMHTPSRGPHKPAYSSPTTAPHTKRASGEDPQNARSSPRDSSGNKRLSDIKKNTQRSSKRFSEISNASSTASGGTRKRTIGQWQLGKTVGKGGCSTVRLVRHVVTGQVGAVKIISRKMAEQVRAQSLANLVAAPDPSLQDLVAAGKALPPPPVGLMREIAIMKLLDHPNIVRLHDVWENHNELYLVMEFVEGGELFHYVEEMRGLEERETVYIFRQIVAALLYCHRLHIHHRDLKPENILLDRDNAQVKLVDFGMAALQPEGKQLTTACGSPHYAAPEVIRSRPYDGAKADVWSCGVILYVMLTGTTPFNYDREQHIHVMYQAIASAHYYMPPELSFHAKDLLRRIFVPDPLKRISMEDIWDHPLLHKYDHEFGYTGNLSKKEAWIGPDPKLDQWTVTREEDIDKDIVRNMCTLWHSVPQHILIQKLLSKQPNQEKYFYAALLKHREENLENYTGGPEGVAHSASDYQHNRPQSQPGAPAIPQEQQQSKSSYSIMNNEHLRSSSIADMPAPPSDASYDPYRPDRYPLANKSTNQTRTVVHKREKSGSANGAALRVETLKKANRQASQARASITAARRQSQSPMPAAHSRGHSRSVSRSSINKASRHSLTSSVWPSSPPVVPTARAASAHKRNVSFQHLRKSSNASALTVPGSASAANRTPELQQKALDNHTETEMDPALMSSPTARATQDAHSRKSKTPSAPRGRTHRKSETPSHVIRSEVRKVSSELEKACEEAFFRSSYGSSHQTSYGTHSPYDTPPSSVSGYGGLTEAGRPLPAVPSDTPNTFITRTLEETRLKLAARYAVEGDGDVARYQEVLAKLETLMPSAGEVERRITSAPEPKSVTDLGFLPIITEEPIPDTLKVGKGEPSGARSFTAPHASKQTAPVQAQETIRVVAPSPQNSRQVTSEYRKSNQEEEIPRPKSADGTGRNVHLQVPNPHQHLLRKNSHDSAVGLKMHNANQNETNVLPLQEAIVKKKSSWFKRWKDGKEPAGQASAAQTGQTTDPHPGVPVQLKELDDREAAKPSQLKRDKQPPQPLKLERPSPYTAPSAVSSEFPMRRSPDNESKFSKWLGKFSGKEEPIKAIEIKDPLFSPNTFAPASPPTSTDQPSAITPTTPNVPTQSWFSRFLRLKPESKVLCFNVPRGRARSETYKLLRDWQKHGISDLCYFPAENMITARVDKNNALGIKPVTFRVELFVVLQNGRKVGLSLGRWTQTRGAASSFRQVLEAVERTMAIRGVLVEDESQCNELVGILG